MPVTARLHSMLVTIMHRINMLPSVGYWRELNTFWILQEFGWKSMGLYPRSALILEARRHGSKKKREFATYGVICSPYFEPKGGFYAASSNPGDLAYAEGDCGPPCGSASTAVA